MSETVARNERIWVYGFEIRQVQRFIFAGGRLRDAIGASLFTDGLIAYPGQPGATGWFDKMLVQSAKQCSINDFLGSDDIGLDASFTRFLRRAASGIHIASCHPSAFEILSTMRDIWRRTLFSLVPEMSFNDALVGADNLRGAHKTLQDALYEQGNLPSPKGVYMTPAMAIAPRTGRPMAYDNNESEEQSDHGGLLRQVFFSNSSALLWRFQEEAKGKDWPFDLQDMFAEEEENRQVAIIHADGNNFGQMLRALNQPWGNDLEGDGATFSAREAEYADFCVKVDETIGGSTRKALFDATQKILSPARIKGRRLPARPLMQGGDDVLLIARADTALPWTRAFLAAFEYHASKAFKGLFKEQNLEFPFARVTACAGVAIIGVSHPFLHGNLLAEELAEFAKAKGKTAAQDAGGREVSPSLFAFHRMTQSLSEEYKSIRKKLKAGNGVSLSLNPYWAGPAEKSTTLDVDGLGFPEIADLLSATIALAGTEVGHGPLRELLSQMRQIDCDVKAALLRWEKISRNHDDKAFEAFCAACKKLTGSPLLSDVEGDHFLADLITVRTIVRSSNSLEAIGVMAEGELGAI